VDLKKRKRKNESTKYRKEIKRVSGKEATTRIEDGHK
jgi:hypothetical protein